MAAGNISPSRLQNVTQNLPAAARWPTALSDTDHRPRPSPPKSARFFCAHKKVRDPRRILPTPYNELQLRHPPAPGPHGGRRGERQPPGPDAGLRPRRHHRRHSHQVRELFGFWFFAPPLEIFSSPLLLLLLNNTAATVPQAAQPVPRLHRRLHGEVHASVMRQRFSSLFSCTTFSPNPTNNKLILK
jgi:hypothetical protein